MTWLIPQIHKQKIKFLCKITTVSDKIQNVLSLSGAIGYPVPAFGGRLLIPAGLTITEHLVPHFALCACVFSLREIA
jgi:hypothetical protein